MATVDNLTLEISADATKALTSLNKVSTALKTLKDSLPTKQKLEGTAQGFKTLTEQISKLSLSTKSLNQIKAMGTIANSLKKMSSISPSNIKKTAENLDSLQGSMANISYQAVEKIERLASAFSLLAQSNKGMGSLANLKKTANLSAQANPISTTPVESGVSSREVSEAFSDVSNEAKEATESVGGFWTKFQTVQNLVKTNPISLLANAESADKMSSLAKTAGMSVGVLTKLSKVLGWVGIALSVVSVATKIFTGAIKLVLKPIKNFVGGIVTLVKALARIAMYRAIRGVLKSITQGLKEGIQNLALYSKALEELDAHSANNVMSRYASEFLYFKNAVATAVIPVLRALIPYVETAINTLIKFVNVLAQVGSAVFGTEYTKAKYFWVDYADSLDDANGRAKALKHQLAGFDELNNLTDNAGGSGSDKLLDASQMFEEALIDPKIKNWVDSIVNKIKTGLANIKTTVKPYTDKLKKFFDDFKAKVLPNLKTAGANLKSIWKDSLKPILDSFIKGFFKGLAEGDYDNTIDFFEDLSKRVKGATEKLKNFADKIPMDKVQKFAEKVGFLTGKFLALYHPIRDNIQNLLNIYDLIKAIQKFIDDKFAKSIDNAKDKFEKWKPHLETVATIIATLVVQIPLFSTNVGTLANKIKTAKDNTDNLGKMFDALKSYFQKVNPFKDLTNNSLDVATVLNYIKTVVEWLKTVTKITLDFTINVTGMDKLDKIKDFLGLNVKPETPSTSSGGTGGGHSQGGGSTTDDLAGRLKLKGHTRANGGYVPKGDLFVANEKVPEMIGHIGGNTAVANNDQITEAIAQATYGAMSRALAENGGSMTIVVEGDGDKMFRVFQKKQREYNRQTGMA